MIDRKLPRFSQAVQAVALGAAFVTDARIVVFVFCVLLGAAVLGGPRANLLAYAYRALTIAPGELEPAAPHRFAQALGTAMLALSTVCLYALEPGTTAWWWAGWGPALAVAVLSAVAAATPL
jgi:hypothetical protein